MPEEAVKGVFPPLDCTAVRSRVMWKSSLFFLFCPLRGQVDMKVTYCGDGPSFAASVDTLITSLLQFLWSLSLALLC